MSIPVTAGFKVLAAWIAGSNPAAGTDVPLVSAKCYQVEVQQRTDPSSRGDLPIVYVSLTVIRGNNSPVLLQ